MFCTLIAKAKRGHLFEPVVGPGSAVTNRVSAAATRLTSTGAGLPHELQAGRAHLEMWSILLKRCYPPGMWPSSPAPRGPVAW